ncbi:MAG: hypothetical protein F6K17_17560 [Okeania sp. SIO3C4]|nr:hypothetical protein [Okeania sp. SIO3C4]
MIELIEAYHVSQWIELIAGFPLLSISIMFIFEKRRKSLIPIGFLLFSITADLLTGHLFLLVKYLPEDNIKNQFLLIKDALLSLLAIGVSFGILFWSVIIFVHEYKIRIILKKRRRSSYQQ